MKQYVIDELRPGESERLRAYLEATIGFSGVRGVYWLPLEPVLYTQTQAAHAECQPFYAAIVLTEGSVSVELLIRTKNRIRCDCIAHATAEQSLWLMERLDTMFTELEIPY
jgi:hypothetical protein